MALWTMRSGEAVFLRTVSGSAYRRNLLQPALQICSPEGPVFQQQDLSGSVWPRGTAGWIYVQAVSDERPSKMVFRQAGRAHDRIRDASQLLFLLYSFPEIVRYGKGKKLPHRICTYFRTGKKDEQGMRIFQKPQEKSLVLPRLCQGRYFAVWRDLLAAASANARGFLLSYTS